MEEAKVPNTTPEIKLHFLDYWRIIRMRKTIIFMVWLLIVLTATLVSFKLEKKYLATTQMMVEKPQKDLPELGGRSFMVSTFDPFYIQGQFILLKSSSLLEPVIMDLKLQETWGKRYNNGQPLTMKEALRFLSRKVSYDNPRNTAVIEISAESEVPEEAAQIANAIAAQYRTYRQDQTKSISKGGLEAQDAEVERQRLKVVELEKRVDDLRQQYGITDFEAQNSTITATLDEQTLSIQGQTVQEALSQLNQLASIYDKLKDLKMQELRRSIPPRLSNFSLTQSLDRLNQYEMELKRALEDFGENHPTVAKARLLYEVAERQVDDLAKGILFQLKTEMEAAQALLEKTEIRLKEAKSEDIRRAGETRPYWTAKEELRVQKNIWNMMSSKAIADHSDAMLPSESTVNIFTPAQVPDRSYRPNIPLIIVLAVMVGLMMGVGLAFFIEYLDTSVKTIDDVERAVQAPVLGVIPQNVGKLLDEGPESPHAEAYRVLRTNILFSRKNDKHNSITIVSGGAGEGKSTTLFNLATVFAQTGERIIIVDSDLRRPSLHKLVGVSNSIGLTNYLLRQNTLEEVIQTTSLPTLDLMPSGKLPSSSMGILSSPQMKELIQELKKRYDYVFFDSPPIMGVSDASILASEMEMTLQVIQYRRYPQQMTIRAKQMIDKVGGNLLGIVLNNISMGQDDNYYYYSGYYTDYYSKQEENGEAPKKVKRGTETAKVEVKRKF